VTADLSRFRIGPDASIRDAMGCIDRNAKGIALVIDEKDGLLATVTDGDIRRAILDRVDPAESVRLLIERRAGEPFLEPLTALAGTATADLLRLMTEHKLRHVPLVDVIGHVVDLAILEDLVREYELPLTAVVMAGGFGTRLQALTATTPKPMLPLAGRPLLEHIIEQLRACGIRRVNVTTHYRPEVISGHFGDGSGFGVEIDYVNEEEPLGTAGAISLLEHSDEPLLVMNGDILTRVDFRAMLEFHHEQQALMTIAVREEEFQLPFGVVRATGELVHAIEEKPVLREFVNAGIYLLDPEVRRHVPSNRSFDMPELVELLIADGGRVVSFPVHEYWLDIGHAPSYERAQSDLDAGKLER
jgi:dTDP-glucose pyrophosphorylase